jgi:hypothetical protein
MVSQQFIRVTEILDGVAEKIVRLDSDPKIKDAALEWRKAFRESLQQPEAVSFATADDDQPEGKK